mmetsp:Transcript_87469/g.265397  ORF Transcript_87469/g.265397 Transcript_87469/m.265397 type:complete len:204 (+) Transcript_87469:620-1231(+)
MAASWAIESGWMLTCCMSSSDCRAHFHCRLRLHARIAVLHAMVPTSTRRPHTCERRCKACAHPWAPVQASMAMLHTAWLSWRPCKRMREKKHTACCHCAPSLHAPTAAPNATESCCKPCQRICSSNWRAAAQRGLFSWALAAVLYATALSSILQAVKPQSRPCARAQCWAFAQALIAALCSAMPVLQRLVARNSASSLSEHSH